MSFIGTSDGEVPVALARVGMGVFRYIKASYGFWWLLYGCVGGASAGKGVVADVLKHIKFSYIFAGLLMRG